MAGRTVVVVCVALLLTGCAAQRTPIQDAPNPAASTASSGAGSSHTCPPPMKPAAGSAIAIDYIDTFRLLGHDYVASPDPVPRTWDPNHPGAPAGRIFCTLSAYPVDPSYQLHDADASYLPVGTDLYLLTTSKGTTVAVVWSGGHWKTYTRLAKS